MMYDGLRLLGVPFLYGNMFKKVIMSCTRNLVISFWDFVTHGVTSTSHFLLDCPDGYLKVPYVII